MGLVHVVPEKDVIRHVTSGGANCFCEPEVKDCGRQNDPEGKPARVFVHQRIRDKMEQPIKGNRGR
jgi:hypothetical protein